MQNNTWHPFIRGQHWLTVLLMLLCLVAVWSHEAFEKSDPLRAQLMQLHFLSGGLVGLLTLSRVLTRQWTTAPTHNMPATLKSLAKAGHIGLYGLMALLPILGFVAVSGKGQVIDLLGLFQLDPLPIDKTLAKGIKKIHEGLANGLIVLIALHIGAALCHALLFKDKVLDAMLGKSTVKLPSAE